MNSAFTPIILITFALMSIRIYLIMTDGLRITREGGLLDIKIPGFEESRVSRNEIACRETNDIIWNHFDALNLLPLSVSQHVGAWRDFRLQPLDGLLRTMRLYQIESVAQDDNRNDGHRVRRFAEHGRGGGRDQENDGQRI